MNHGRVAEELAEALCEISEDISEIQIDLEMFRTPELVEKVADLYAHIFIFLSSYMDHLMRKRTTRLLDSFNENASQKFAGDIKRIRDKATRIRYMVNQSHVAEGRDTHLTVEQIAADIRVGREGDERHRAEISDFASRLQHELRCAREERRDLDGRVIDLGSRLTNLLEHQAREYQALKRELLEQKRMNGMSPP